MLDLARIDGTEKLIVHEDFYKVYQAQEGTTENGRFDKNIWNIILKLYTTIKNGGKTKWTPTNFSLLLYLFFLIHTRLLKIVYVRVIG